MKKLIKKIARKLTKSFSSIDYWEGRYKSGGNSGSGSYNKLAEYKASFINDFLLQKSIQSAIEFGCGDGNQLSLIDYPSYIGLDVSTTSISICTQKFRNDNTKRFLLYDPFSPGKIPRQELSLSLDVIYHLVEDKVYELYMKHLFQSATAFVIIYSSDYDRPRLNHEKRREFSNWVEKNQTHWRLIVKKESPFKSEPNESNKSFSDFFVYEKISGQSY